MSKLELPRRKFLAGLAGIIAAGASPAIVRAADIKTFNGFKGKNFSLSPPQFLKEKSRRAILRP